MPMLCSQQKHITSKLSHIPLLPMVNYCNPALNNPALNETQTWPPHLVTASNCSILECLKNHDQCEVGVTYANKSNPPPALSTDHLIPTHACTPACTPAPAPNTHTERCLIMPHASYTQVTVTGHLIDVLVQQLHILCQITVITKQLYELLGQISHTCANSDQHSVYACQS